MHILLTTGENEHSIRQGSRRGGVSKPISLLNPSPNTKELKSSATLHVDLDLMLIFSLNMPQSMHQNAPFHI